MDISEWAIAKGDEEEGDEGAELSWFTEVELQMKHSCDRCNDVLDSVMLISLSRVQLTQRRRKK